MQATNVTPKAFNSTAQGSPAEPGYPGLTSFAPASTLKGLHFSLSDFPRGTITMSQSLTQIYMHIVFSTAERRSCLQDRIIRGRMHAYLHGICEKQKSPSIAVGGVEVCLGLIDRWYPYRVRLITGQYPG